MSHTGIVLVWASAVFVQAAWAQSVAVNPAASQPAEEEATKKKIDSLIEDLASDDGSKRDAAAMALPKLHSPYMMQKLTESLKDKRHRMRDQAARMLAEVRDTAAVEPLLELLKSAEPRDQETAVYALGRMEDKRAVKPIISLLQGREGRPNLRILAVDALGRLADVTAVEPIKRLFDEANDEFLRTCCARALYLLGDKEGEKAAMEVLKGENWGLRVMIVQAIGDCRDASRVDLLLELLKNDKESAIRAEAARSLGKIGDPRALPALRAAVARGKLGSVNPHVYQEAIDKLENGASTQPAGG